MEAALDETREGGTNAEDLYRQQGARLWRSLLAFTGDPDVASDALSEAFAQLLRRGHGVRDPERWLWRVAFRIAAGDLKERRRADPLPEDRCTYEMEEPARDLLDALMRLSPHQRAAVVLHHAAGYRVKEIAAILGSTPAAVRVHLSRARKRLRALLEEAEA
jgi:RNA polymerase sigma-70 factor (ECF subfamily)